MPKEYKISINIGKHEMDYLIYLLRKSIREDDEEADTARNILLSIEYQKLEQDMKDYSEIIDFN
jgi:hypothetical protein